MELKERIKELRQRKGVTQKALGEALGITSIAEQRYEYGERIPNLKMLVALADYFDVSLDYLVGRSPNPKFDRWE